jgi:hypothetical protein
MIVSLPREVAEIWPLIHHSPPWPGLVFSGSHEEFPGDERPGQSPPTASVVTGRRVPHRRTGGKPAD